jgi:hypothetical protein
VSAADRDEGGEGVSERIADLLSAAMVECEKEKNATLDRRAEGDPLPRKWFAYDALQRRLKPRYHEAKDQARRA